MLEHYPIEWWKPELRLYTYNTGIYHLVIISPPSSWRNAYTDRYPNLISSIPTYVLSHSHQQLDVNQSASRESSIRNETKDWWVLFHNHKKCWKMMKKYLYRASWSPLLSSLPPSHWADSSSGMLLSVSVSAISLDPPLAKTSSFWCKKYDW